MKLIARKSMIALGTAAALSLTTVTAPAMATDETTNTTTTDNAGTDNGNANSDKASDADKSATENGNADADKADADTDETGNGNEKSSSETVDDDSDKEAEVKGDPYYAERYKLVEGQLNRYQASYDELLKLINTRAGQVTADSEASSKIESARFHLNTANQTLTDVRQDLTPLPHTGYKNDPEYGTLNALKDTLRNVNTELEAAKRDYDAAKPLECNAKIAKEEGNDSGSGFDSLSSSFGSLFDSLGSSGQMVVRKDGKPRCVSKAEYYSEKLTKVVAILGTVFTLITTMTKISDTIQKQAMPKN